MVHDPLATVHTVLYVFVREKDNNGKGKVMEALRENGVDLMWLLYQNTAGKCMCASVKNRKAEISQQ